MTTSCLWFILQSTCTCHYILAPKYFKSLKAGEPLTLDTVNTIATGLAPPFAGIKMKININIITHFCINIFMDLHKSTVCKTLKLNFILLNIIVYLGKNNFEVINKFVEGIILVSDEEIKRYNYNIYCLSKIACLLLDRVK